MQISDERKEDSAAIYTLIQSAFADKDFSSGTEGPIVDALRKSGDLTLSLVAKRSDSLVGHIAFSPAIGTELIQAGLARLQAIGARACVLVGDPKYYHRFGFVGDCGLRSGDLPPIYVQALVWGEPLVGGEISFALAFSTGSNQP